VSEFRVYDSRLMVSGLAVRVLRFRVQGSGFRI